MSFAQYCEWCLKLIGDQTEVVIVQRGWIKRKGRELTVQESARGPALVHVECFVKAFAKWKETTTLATLEEQRKKIGEKPSSFMDELKKIE